MSRVSPAVTFPFPLTIEALHEDHVIQRWLCDDLERVAGVIGQLAERSGTQRLGGGIDVSIPMSRGEMADLLGLTSETVSRQLTRLKAADLITFAKGERDCVVLDPAGLDRIANPA